MISIFVLFKEWYKLSYSLIWYMHLKIVIVYPKVFLFCWYWDQNIAMLFNNSMGFIFRYGQKNWRQILKDNRHKRCLESRKQRAGLRVKEEFLYVCGSTLFPGGDMQDKILVKESLHCGSPIETTYYSGIYSDFSQNYNVLFNKKGNKAQLFIW